MTIRRLAAILFIYGCTAIAWFALGGTIVGRTGEFDSKLQAEVAQLWGGRHVQTAPTAAILRPRTVEKEIVENDADGRVRRRKVSERLEDEVRLLLDSSRIRAGIELDQRQKGLLWFDTYKVDFHAEYRFLNPDPEERQAVVRFAFPSREAIYDGLEFRVNGAAAPSTSDLAAGLTSSIRLPPHGASTIEIAYQSRGLGDWSYAFVEQGVAQVKDFVLDLTTDFEAIDFPAGTLSPKEKERRGPGWHLRWAFASLAAGQRIGVDAPSRINPGPLAARITFFAPVSLLFFFTVLVTLGVLCGRSLHPMNYFFLAAAFFAFHLLLAYLADHVQIHAAFLISAATSLFLVTSYLRLVTGMRVALVEAGVAQVVFLFLFGYAFFFEGYTGLAVTVGAIVTLFVLMQVTARVDWSAVFSKGDAARPSA